MSVVLDHILWATPDLEKGSAQIEALTGVMPARGGSHPGFGTRNSLLSLGDTYLEIIAPDPEQQLQGNRGGAIAKLAHSGLITFAVSTTNIDAYRAGADRAGIATRGPVEMGRTRPDGVRLDWACLYIADQKYGEIIPFAIDWKGSPHPSASAPWGCRLASFTVLHPDPAPLTAIFKSMSIPVAVKGATTPGFLATIDTPRGEVVLTA